MEVVVDVIRNARGPLGRETLFALIEPDGLPGKTASTSGAKASLDAAKELGLLKEEARVTLAFKSDVSTRALVLDALDRQVLGGKTDVEPYFALFYAYVLGRDAEGAKHRAAQDWVKHFNADVFGDELPTNPFNPTKLSGLHRWFGYVGLGWYDPKDVFQCCPYERLRRRLSVIFQRSQRLSDVEFMNALAETCPELDGGELFLRANRDRDQGRKRCTLGLAHALIELHIDEVIRLHCGDDSGGYSLELAEPPRDGHHLRSARLDFVEYLEDRKEASR
ncbi:hypothetical protein [Sorangium sp. So ce388]|uniref:hypothetical protein n=1 Tax=Sorangium sp. So ce388 TaxID=3133309 RepID=UPI003F5C5287